MGSRFQTVAKATWTDISGTDSAGTVRYDEGIHTVRFVQGNAIPTTTRSADSPIAAELNAEDDPIPFSRIGTSKIYAFCDEGTVRLVVTPVEDA